MSLGDHDQRHNLPKSKMPISEAAAISNNKQEDQFKDDEKEEFSFPFQDQEDWIGSCLNFATTPAVTMKMVSIHTAIHMIIRVIIHTIHIIDV